MIKQWISLLPFLALTIFFPSICLGASPIIYFSDLTDGSTSGWEQSSTRGAAVSIWGLNFGNLRGNSYVKVGGVKLTNDSDYAEWGSTTNPTTPRRLQRITFWLTSSMSTEGTKPNSTISVTTASGTSNPIVFHCRAIGSSHIYFVSTTGNDSNSGLTTSNPWATFKKVRETVNAGDVVYFREGTWTAEDDYGNGSILTLRTIAGVPNHTNGSAYNSITLASYPGEVAQVGDGTQSPTDKFLYRQYSTAKSEVSYWTFSKFKAVCYNKVFGWVFDNNRCIDDNVRIIGFDLTTTGATYGTGIGINPYSEIHSMKIYGNNMHHVGKVNNDDPYGYKVEPIYFGGGSALSEDIDIGWNEFYNNNGTIQFFGHFATDHIDDLKFHDNFVHKNGTSIIVIGGGDPSGSSYVFVKNAYVYNNIFSGNRGDMRITGHNNSGFGGNFFIYNNTFYDNCLDSGTSRELHIINVGHCEFKNNIVYAGTGSANGYYTNFGGSSANITGLNNSWFGQGAGPTWDTSNFDNINPQFIIANPVNYYDFRLKDSSPIVVTGKKIGVYFDSVWEGGVESSISSPQGFELITDY